MLEYFPPLLLNSTFVGVRTSLTFFIAFLCSFWLSGQNVNPFELHQGQKDTVKTSIEGSDVVVEVQPVPVISQTVPQVPAEQSDPQADEMTVVTESQNLTERNTSAESSQNSTRNPFDLVHSKAQNPNELSDVVGFGTSELDNESVGLEVNVQNEELEGSAAEPFDTQKTAIVVNPFNVNEGTSEESSSSDIALTTEEATEGKVSSDDAKSIKVENEKPVYVNTLPEKKNTFVFWVVLLSGLLLSFLLTGNRKIINEILKSLSNVNYMKLFQKEERNGASVSFIILYIIYVLNASIFLRFAAIEFEMPLFGYSFILILLAVLTIVLLRHFSLNVVSYLRKRLPDAINYSFIIAMVNAIVGLVLIPVNLLIAFGPESMARNIVFLGVGILIFAFILKWLRGFVNSARIIFGDSFHFLLYLCTCEIVPICICVGFLRNLIN